MKLTCLVEKVFQNAISLQGNWFTSSLANIGKNISGSGGIRTHAPEETGALNQRLRPLGHATLLYERVGVIVLESGMVSLS